MDLLQLAALLKNNPDALAAFVDLCDAFTDFTDGDCVQDIIDNTGNTRDRSIQIMDLSADAIAVVNQHRLGGSK